LLVDTSQNYGNELNFQHFIYQFYQLSRLQLSQLSRVVSDAINKQITNHSIFISIKSKPTETVERNRLYNNTIKRLIRIDNEL